MQNIKTWKEVYFK